MSVAKSSNAGNKQLGNDIDPNALLCRVNLPIPDLYQVSPLQRSRSTWVVEHPQLISICIAMANADGIKCSMPEHEASLEDLIDIANPISRRNSRQLKDPQAERVRPEAFSKIIDVVFRYDGSTMFPLEAVELLNPRIIKQANRYSNTRKRKDYTKDHNGQCLPRYPCSLVQVKWRDTGESSWEQRRI
jgi:hypothetical protein